MDMAERLHREIFTWPSAEAFVPGSRLSPKDIGFDLIEEDAQTEIENMIEEVKVQKKDEPFCVFDLGTVVERYRLWCRAFPTIQPFYALKAYDDPVVIKLLAELGAGFDCASKAEIELVKKLGVKPDNIVFANPIKLPSHISYAKERGVSLMTFDSQDELVKVKELYPQARLLLRICPQANVQVQAPISCFGCSLDAVPGLLRTATCLGLSVVGVAFHIGSGCYDPNIYVEQIGLARKVFDFALNEGIQMNILDIGGGFFGTKDAEKFLLQMCDPINSSIRKCFPGVKVISEPGRFFVESGLTMAASVIGRHTRMPRTQATGGFVLSASAFGILNKKIITSCFGSTYYPKLALRKSHSEAAYTQTLRGPTVSPIDEIPCGNLPELQLGDWLIFQAVGTYSASLSTAFNGFPKPPIRRVMKREVWESLTNGILAQREF